MSFELIRQVWLLDLSPTEQQVLMAMADYADDDGCNCFPSHRRLAWKTGYKERTISRMIEGFIASGIVKVLRLGTNKQPPRYQICLENGRLKAPYCHDDDDSRGDPRSPQEDSRGDRGSSQNGLGRSSITSGGDRRSSWGDRRSPDPIINQSNNLPGNGNGPFPETAPEKETAAETARKWQYCVQELGAQHKTFADWLQGSELMETGEKQDGKPLYKLVVVKANSVDWLRQTGRRAICTSLRSMWGVPVSLEITAELPS